MAYNIVEETNLFNNDGSTNPPFNVVDHNSIVVFIGMTREECEDYIQTI
jgi:hypothetical protein